MPQLKVNNTISIQLITSKDCSECIQAKQVLKEAKLKFSNLQIKEYDVMDLKGLELAVKHGVMANPGIIINGELFSAGSLNKEKLLAYLHSKSYR